MFSTAQPSPSRVSPDGWQYSDHLWGPRSEVREESQEARRLRKIWAATKRYDILYSLWEKGYLPLFSRAYLYKIHTKVAFGQKELCNRFYHCSLWIANIQCQPSLADSWFLRCLWPIQLSILTPWDLHLKWPSIPLTTRLGGHIPPSYNVRATH